MMMPMMMMLMMICAHIYFCFVLVLFIVKDAYQNGIKKRNSAKYDDDVKSIDEKQFVDEKNYDCSTVMYMNNTLY